MTEQQYGRRAVETGPTGKIVAENLARLRKVRGFSTRQLAAALEAKGRSISASGISRMEKAERHVTADELVALAAILRVNPSALMLPPTDSPGETVEITGVGTVGADAAWDWMDGEMPIERVEPGDPQSVLTLFQVYARPVGRRMQLAPPDKED